MKFYTQRRSLSLHWLGELRAPLGGRGGCGLHLEGGVDVVSTRRGWLLCAPLGGRGWRGLHLEGGVGVGPTWRVGLVWAPLGGWRWCGPHLEGGVGEGSTWRAGLGRKRKINLFIFQNFLVALIPNSVSLFQGMQLHRKAAEERLSGNTGGVSFLARQRQASSRRSTPNRTQQTAAVGSRLVLLY